MMVLRDSTPGPKKLDAICEFHPILAALPTNQRDLMLVVVQIDLAVDSRCSLGSGFHMA
jgi:hypothetical protein